jgi:hypothetical protein
MGTIRATGRGGMKLVEAVVVVLELWQSPTYGPRASLLYRDEAIVTRGTEFEARQYARDMGWAVEREAEEDAAPE